MPVLYKYKFWEWLFELPRAEHSAFKAEVARVAGVTAPTVTKWFDMPADAAHDAPFTAVLFICLSFGKKPEEARNYLPGHELKITNLLEDKTAVKRKKYGLK
jgi:hypothetical protein